MLPVPLWPFDWSLTPEVIAAATQDYRTATPFPHVVLDGWFRDSALLEVVAQFAAPLAWHTYEDRKRGFNGVADWPFFAALNSEPVLRLLRHITGQPDLVPDPTYRGGGLHAVPRGGRLGLHVDFNRHKDLPLERRLNTILYLNRDWPDDWGGALTLTDRQACTRTIPPLFNRWVIFGYGPEAWHGHPVPLTCPEGTERRSAAVYYYRPLTTDLAFTGTTYA